MRGITRSLVVSIWFMLLTFPLLVIKVVPNSGQIIWRFENCLWLGVGIFFLSFVWRAFMVRKGMMTMDEADLKWLFDLFASKRNQDMGLGMLVMALGATPYALAASGGSYTSLPGLILLAVALAIAFLYFTGRREYIASAYSTTSDKLTLPGLPRTLAAITGLAFLISLVFIVDTYRVNVLISTFIWIMLGLGLSIVVGQAGMLVLGYVAFYAVGAYTYALGNLLLGGSVASFWIFLPIGGFLAALAGILLSLPILRLRGDYLAIVTLGFGEIVRVVLEGGSLSLAPLADFIRFITGLEMPGWMYTPLEMGGPAGIAAIPAPGLPGLDLSLDGSARFLYFVALAMACFTIFAVARLRDSRLGRSWIALREDEIACEAMGINKVSAKLSAFALGACWAGFGGVLFAAKNSFINPSSFTFMESALILSVVVLGGLGSIFGVILGACVLILLPEYLRSFDEYRMLIFGASMVLMMVFRPQGLIQPQFRKRRLATSISGGNSAVSAANTQTGGAA